MQLPIIITGAAGRMGSTLVRLVKESKDLYLTGLVEPDITKLNSIDCVNSPDSPECPACIIASDLSTLLSQVPPSIVIDFTAIEASMKHAQLLYDTYPDSSLIIGTTGLGNENIAKLHEMAKNIRLFLSPNMSVGINVLLDILPKLTAMLGDTYDTELMEIHHNRKKDAPSGTAIRLGQAIAEGKGWNYDDVANYHREGIIGERPHEEIGMQTIRGGDVVGVHTIYYMGAGERIEITHHAHSRENFAGGALRAARWISQQKSGRLYSMQDVLHDGAST